MKHIESEFKGVGGLKIYYQAWLPDKPKAVVQVVHGFAEHSGRYMHVVNALIPLGYAVYADDHRGHGKSEGIINFANSMDEFVEDEKKLYDIIKNRHKGLPIFMLGHSMGSGIAVSFVIKYESLLSGLILSGSGKNYGNKGGALKFMAKLISKIAPKMSASSGLDANFLSHDPEEVKAYVEDPLVRYKKCTSKLAHIMFAAFSKMPETVKDFKLPLLFQRGSDDQAVTEAEEVISGFQMDDKTIIIYDDLYHEVYNELEKDRKKVLKDLSDWLEKHF